MNEKKIIKVIIYLSLLFVLLIGLYGFSIYRKVYMPNVKIKEKYYNLYIPTGSDFDDVIEIIKNAKILINEETFLWACNKKNYHKKIFPGHYKIKDRMSNNSLINKLRSGKQDPVKVIINNIKTKEQLIKCISEQIEADSFSLAKLLEDEKYLNKSGFNKENILCLFIPNTYEFWWNTSATQFFDRMYKEYNKFWNEERLNKAKEIGMSPIEVAILASIVEEETIYDNEMPMIAGVYINRLKKHIPLQADPTIKFALGDLSIKRILKKDLEINSPYNTYKNIGLPPGPICIPSIKSIESVLNYTNHDFLYFCAKDDFSGYHTFSKTLEEHNLKARLYQKKLNKNKILR